jgi:hypothetical protein
VVERAVLHHQDDDRVDRHVARARQRHAPLTASGLGDQRVGVEHGSEARREAGRQRCALEELAPAQVLVGRLRLELLRAVRIPQVRHRTEA